MLRLGSEFKAFEARLVGLSLKLRKSKIAMIAKTAKIKMGFLLKKLLLFGGILLPPCWFGLLFICLPFDTQNLAIRLFGFV